ncbi:MAG: DUF4399 domain-containing protein [Ardenticatenaceae bacterium]
MNVTKTGLIHTAILLLSLMIVPLLSACSGTSPKVFFVEPTDGSTVSSPVQVKMGADNFTIEPAGEVREGAGHLHITVNDACSPVGEIIPADDTHIHYGKGQTETELQLPPGEHKLCLQAADGVHAVLDGDGMTQQITITVE